MSISAQATRCFQHAGLLAHRSRVQSETTAFRRAILPLIQRSCANFPATPQRRWHYLTGLLDACAFRRGQTLMVADRRRIAQDALYVNYPNTSMSMIHDTYGPSRRSWRPMTQFILCERALERPPSSRLRFLELPLGTGFFEPILEHHAGP